jgi:uncharacterized protein YndB with AHSA1/START domain
MDVARPPTISNILDPVTTGQIPAPASIVWRILTDTHAWPRWGPSVRAVKAPHRYIEPGDEGRVQTAVGL